MSEPWPSVRLGNVLVERREVPDAHNLTLGTMRIISKIGFDEGKIELRSEAGTRTGMILVRPGDLVVSGINATKGAIAIYGRENKQPVAATIHYGAYEVSQDRADLTYLWWYLRSSAFREVLLEAVPGGIKTELKSSRLLPIEFPLPPLAAQRRIVARIEELAAKIAEARTLRHQAAEVAKALPLAELSAVFRRACERHGTERLEVLFVEAGYGSSEKCELERMEEGTPVLRIPNIASERITIDDLKYAHLSQRDRQRLLLSEGDVLIVRTNGSLNLVGRSAVIPELDEPFAFASYLIRLRFDGKRIAPDYAQRMLQHLRVSGALVDFARTTAGQYNVSLGRLRSAEIPVPPLPDQRRIVAYLDGLQVKVDGLKRLQTQTAGELDALLPAILDRAFKGEL